MEFNCEGQNGGDNGGIMMYNYGLDDGDLVEHFLVLTYSNSNNPEILLLPMIFSQV